MNENNTVPVVAEMQETLRDAGLSPAPVPGALASDLRLRGPWCWSTRDIDPMTMYLFRDYPVEVLLGAVPEYLAVSHAGYGVNSYAITYQLVFGGLAAFVQVLWGGAYVDSEESAAKVRDQFAKLTTLVGVATSRGKKDAAAPTGLVVLDSPFRAISVCAAIPRPLNSPLAAHRWLADHPASSDPLAEAVELWT